jgi:hypothetical protein
MSKYTNHPLPSFVEGLDHRLKNNVLASLTSKFHGGVLFHAKRIMRVFAIEKTDVRNVNMRDIRNALTGPDYDNMSPHIEHEAYRNAVAGIELANYFGSLKSAMSMKNLYVGHGERDGDFRLFLEGKKTPWAAVPADMEEELVPGDNEATRQQAYKVARENAGFVKANFAHLDWYASQLERIAAGETFGNFCQKYDVEGADPETVRADAAWGYLSEQYRENIVDALHAKLVELRQTCRAKRQNDEWVGPADYRYIHSVILKYEQLFYVENHLMSAEAAIERQIAEAMAKQEAEMRADLMRRAAIAQTVPGAGAIMPSKPVETGGNNSTANVSIKRGKNHLGDECSVVEPISKNTVRRAPKLTKAEKELAALIAAQEADDNNSMVEQETFGVDAGDLAGMHN